MAGSTATSGRAAVRLAVQKEVFTPAEERLLGLAAVTKPGRKKKVSYLCVSVNPQEKPPRVFISRVKKDDQRKEKQSYKRVKKWDLSELRLVDGKTADTEVPEFDLHIERTSFKWVANNVAEKKAFIICLYKMVHKYLTKNIPEFVHVDEPRLKELLVTAESGGRGHGVMGEEEEAVQQEEYQELTEREQEDLEKMLPDDGSTKGQQGIQDAEVFTEHLSQQLAQLDEANIHTLMDSETQIFTLMKRIDGTMFEIQQTDSKLAVYDELLNTVRGNMSKLSKDYSRITIWDRNLKLLLEQVEDIVDKLYLDPSVERTLHDVRLSGDSNVREVTRAVKDLYRVTSQQLSPGVQMMQAVSDQRNYFTELSREFGKRLQTYLCNSFTHKATSLTENIIQRSTTLPSLQSHEPVHTDLVKYSELTKWMKESENQKFQEVCKAYCTEFRKVYDNEMKAFLADVKSLLSRGGDMKKSGGMSKHGGSSLDLRGSDSPTLGDMRGLSTSLLDFAQGQSLTRSTSISAGITQREAGKTRFDQIFLLVLDQLQPLCMSEQKFCTTFFHFPKQEDDDGSSNECSPEPPLEDEDTDGIIDAFSRTRKRSPRAQSVESGIMSEGVMGLLQQLFNCLLSELEALIIFGEKIDSYNSLYLLVAVSQRVMFAREGGQLSYLDRCLQSSLVALKRLFDKFVESREKAIQECKVPRKSGKCGVLPCVTEFGQFAERAERIMMGSDRRMDLDKAYHKLIEALFEAIERLAEQHPKTPRNVVLFENYHKLADILRTLKIQCLSKAQNDARARKATHQQEYVIDCLGKPLDKISHFFDGVERLLASGMNPEQIGFNRDYNRTELLKCIQAYPGKEVKKGLEKLYRRIEKDLSDEVGLVRVVWGAMQKAFMEQYQHFLKLIEKCYRGSNIKFEFTLEEVIEYFQLISEGK